MSKVHHLLTIKKGPSNKSYPVFKTTPSSSPLHRGRADYQAVSPPVQGGVSGGSFSKSTFGTAPLHFKTQTLFQSFRDKSLQFLSSQIFSYNTIIFIQHEDRRNSINIVFLYHIALPSFQIRKM